MKDPFKTVLTPGTIVKKDGKYGVVDMKGNIEYSGMIIMTGKMIDISTKIKTKPTKTHRLSIKDKLELR